MTAVGFAALLERSPSTATAEDIRRDLDAYLAANAPFDGVLGFSQGAALAGLLVGWRPSPFRFAVMIGGFTSRDPEHAQLYGKADHYRIPSLHMIGRADGVVEPARSRELAAAFAKPTIVEHAGGHVIASDTESQTKVRLFVEAARDRRFAETP